MDYPDFEKGLTALDALLRPARDSTYLAFLALEMRIKENLRDEFRYGSTEQLRHERARIINSLNELTLSVNSHATFNDLCRSRGPSVLQKLLGQSVRGDAGRLPQLKNGESYMNRFTIKGFIGRGGFSDVYIAWDSLQDREVCLKLLATNPQQPTFLRRFAEREATMAHRVSQHKIPGLVVTHDVIPVKGGVCLVQENLPGQSLHSRLKRMTVLDPHEAIKTAIGICNTLDSLHQIGIAHCDIKPLNIIVPTPGNPILIDLGAARDFRERIDRRDIVVSIPYSPQELLSGEPIDGRVDIYSLGMVLLHMLLGLPSWDPLPEETQPLPLHQMLGDAPSEDTIRQYVAMSLNRLDPRLRAGISRVLVVDPEERFPTVGEFQAELSDHMNTSQWT